MTDSHPQAGAAALPAQRRAQLARHTVALIVDMADSLHGQVQEARRVCEQAGNPDSIAEQLEALLEQSSRLRGQGEQLTRAFAVLDRLAPPAADDADASAGSPAAQRQPQSARGGPARGAKPSGRGGSVKAPRRASGGSERFGRGGGEDETRGAAAAFAVGMKLDGASRELVEARLVEEFGRGDARQIADEAFGRSQTV